MVRQREALLRTQAPRVLLLTALMIAGAGGGCTTNHDALARQPKAGSSGGGSGGVSGFVSGGFGNTGDETSTGGRSNPDNEPKGDDVLTIVNGVIDAPSVRLCFARLSAQGETPELVGTPSVELAYAGSLVLSRIDGLSLVDDLIQPWLLAGQLSRIDELDCQAAVALAQSEEAKVTPSPSDGAGGMSDASLEFPKLRARPLAALPPGTVDIGRSILLVLTGCIGGAAYTDTVEASVCGDAYRPDSPTLEPLVVKLSRATSFGKVGLQAVHAATATDDIDVRASGDQGQVSLVFATGVSFGAIAPRPASTDYAPEQLGVEAAHYGLQALNENGSVLYQEAWSDILAASALPTPVAARTYTAVFLGPDPLLIKEGWWNKSAFALVDNDPTRHEP